MAAILLDVKFETDNARKRLTQINQELNSQKESLAELTKQYKQGLISSEAYAKAQTDNQVAVKALRKEQRDLQRGIELETQAIKSNNESRQQLVAVMELARRELVKQEGTIKKNADGTFELTEAYIKASEDVEKAKNAIIEFDQGIKDGRSNVGNYEESLKSALEGVDLFGVSLGDLNTLFSGGLNNAIKSAQASFASFNATLLANPIFLIVAAIGALVAAFASTEKGANRISQIFARLSESLNGVLSVAVDVGGSIVEAFAPVADILATVIEVLTPFISLIGQGLTQALKIASVPLQIVGFAVNAFGVAIKAGQDLVFGFVDSIKDFLSPTLELLTAPIQQVVDGFNAIAGSLGLLDREAEQRVKRLQELETELIKQESQNAALLAQEEALRLIRDDESKTIEQRIKANERLGKVEQERLTAALKVNQEILNNLEDQLSKVPENLRTNEQLREVEEQRQKVNELLEESFGKQNEQVTNQVSLAKELLETQIAINEATLERDLLTGSIVEGSQQELDARKDLVDKQLDQELKQFTLRNKNLQNLEKTNREELLKTLASSNDVARNLIIRAENEKLKLDKDFRDKQVENYKAYQDQISESEEKIRQEQEKTNEQAQAEELARLQLRVLQANEGSEEELQARIDFLNKVGEIEAAKFQQDSQQQLLVLAKSLQDQNDLRLEFKQKQFDNEDEFNAALEESLQLSSQQNLERIANELAGEDALRLAQIDRQLSQEKFANENLLAEKESLLEKQKRLEVENAQALLDFELEFTAFSDEQRLAARNRYNEALLEIDNRYADAKTEIDQRIVDSELEKAELQAEILGGLASLFEENTAAYKVFATAEAAISTYLAANKAFERGGGFPLGTVLAAITVAQGLANVARIQGVEFASGGMLDLYKNYNQRKNMANGGRVFGKGSGTSDQIPAWLSNGEGVLTAKTMLSNKSIVAAGTPKQIASAMNSQIGGGVSFAEGGFASSFGLINPGVLSSGGTSSTEALIAGQDNLASSFSDMNMQVSVTEINEVQNRVAVTEDLSNS